MTENEPALVRFLPVWHAGALRSGPGIGKVVVDAAIAIHKAHKKQVLTYLRLTGCPPGNPVRTGKLGYLLNFGEDLVKDGITRIINGKLK